MPSPPSVTIVVSYDDDAEGAAEALLAVLQRPADPESEAAEAGASDDEAA